MNLGMAGTVPHGNEKHPTAFVHLAGSIAETITGIKTFADQVLIASGTAAAPGLAFAAGTASGFYRIGSGDVGLAASTGFSVAQGATGSYARLYRDVGIGGALALGLNGTLDAIVVREAAAYLLQRNGTTAQRLGVARTYTDAANYEVGEAGWSGTTFRLGTSHAGTGVARTLALMAGGSERWRLDGTDGHLTAVAGTEQIRWGTTSAFPMWKRSSTKIQARLADDSGDAIVNCGAFTASGLVSLEHTGPHGIGGLSLSTNQLTISGSFPAGGGESRALDIISTLNPASGSNAHGLRVAVTFTEQSGGTHSIFSGVHVVAPAITGGAGAVTTAASVYIEGAPTASGAVNLALFVGGAMRYDGATQTTVGAAGGASALPATPTGYTIINIAGTERAIPYYAKT